MPLRRTWNQLPAGVLPLLPEAVWWLVCGRLGMRWAPWAKVVSWFGFVYDPGAVCEGEPDAGVARVAVAVDIAARRLLPGTLCLPKALAAGKMLARRGIPSVLCVGARRHEVHFDAHAWLRSGRGWVIGQRGSQAAQMVVFYVPRDFRAVS